MNMIWLWLLLFGSKLHLLNATTSAPTSSSTRTSTAVTTSSTRTTLISTLASTTNRASSTQLSTTTPTSYSTTNVNQTTPTTTFAPKTTSSTTSAKNTTTTKAFNVTSIKTKISSSNTTVATTTPRVNKTTLTTQSSTSSTTPGSTTNSDGTILFECFCNLSKSEECQLSRNITKRTFIFKMNDTAIFTNNSESSGVYICQLSNYNKTLVRNNSINYCTRFNESSNGSCLMFASNTSLHVNNCSGTSSLIAWNTTLNIQFTDVVVKLQVNNTGAECAGYNPQTSSPLSGGKVGVAGVVAGAVVGTFVGIFVVVLLVIILLRFRRKRSRAFKQHTSAPNNALAGFSNDTAYRNSDSDLKNYELISVDDDQYSKSRGYQAFQDNTNGDINNTRYTNNRPGDYVQAEMGTGTDVITSETTPAVNNISVGHADKHPDDSEADDGYSTFNNEAKHDYSVLRYRVVETTNPYNVLLGEKQDPKFRDPIPQPRRYSDVSYEGMSPFTEPITNSDDTGVKEVDIIDLSKLKPDDYDYPVMVCDNKANEIDEDEYSTPLSVDNLVRNNERNGTINPYIVSTATQSAPTLLTITQPAPTHQTHTTTNTTGNEQASSQQPEEDESPTYYYTQHSLLKHLQV